jgi:hypothetical protein
MRIRIRPIFQAAVACVIFFLGLEVLARVWSTLRPDLAEASVKRSGFRPSEALGWEWQPEFAGQAENDYREFDSQGFLKVDSKQAAEPGPNTVLFIGDSNTIGFGVPTAASFAEVIEELLPGVSTVNLGVNGYSSYQGLKVLEKHCPGYGRPPWWRLSTLMTVAASERENRITSLASSSFIAPQAT